MSKNRRLPEQKRRRLCPCCHTSCTNDHARILTNVRPLIGMHKLTTGPVPDAV